MIGYQYSEISLAVIGLIALHWVPDFRPLRSLPCYTSQLSGSAKILASINVHVSRRFDLCPTTCGLTASTTTVSDYATEAQHARRVNLCIGSFAHRYVVRVG